MNATRSSPPARTVRPITDQVTVLASAVGWALIVLGLVFLVLSLTN